MSALDFNGKKVLVQGWAKSGQAAASRLLELGAQVVVVNRDPIPVTAAQKALAAAGVVFAGADTAEQVDASFDYVVKNPGISYDQALLKKAATLQIPILTEVAVALSTFTGRLITITGSNGKTTTTTLIGQMLAADQQGTGRVVVAGNIGTPVCQVVGDLGLADTLVLELSSFQLLGLPSIQPDIALITNVFANHLDFHKTRANYLNAKIRITKDQRPDQYLVLNGQSADLPTIAHASAAQKELFDAHDAKAFAHEQGGQLVVGQRYVMDWADVKLVGPQNLENVLAALAVAQLAGASVQAMRTVLRNFAGVAHRLEYLFEKEGVTYYNDSKATDIEATELALAAFQQPTIWLAGGLDRGDDLSRLADSMANVRLVLAFGETQEQIVALAEQKGLPFERVADVAEAARLAVAAAKPGDVVLLSPAAASWDQYPNFEIRGQRYVAALKQAVDQGEA
ncbi:UDP-N-acetylmuramoyl-L-alanine--D-glutamate ligase [Leuconostocaceae bacterium ESL0958]|nr:UDP-N-acetylmuramoyl-L-alanine--D-glutamate ligase [Leuconostocaceae bacterium ESL0958]